MNLPNKEQEKILKHLDLFKEKGCMCGNACPVEGYGTKRAIQC